MWVVLSIWDAKLRYITGRFKCSSFQIVMFLFFPEYYLFNDYIT